MIACNLFTSAERIRWKRCPISCLVFRLRFARGREIATKKNSYHDIKDYFDIFFFLTCFFFGSCQLKTFHFILFFYTQQVQPTPTVYRNPYTGKMEPGCFPESTEEVVFESFFSAIYGKMKGRSNLEKLRP